MSRAEGSERFWAFVRGWGPGSREEWRGGGWEEWGLQGRGPN